jgi:hypothetical protein
MELGFSPTDRALTQVSLQLIDMKTAVHLAIGAYGWLKARGKADSLQAILEASGASLAPISTFDLQKYRAMRTKHPLIGVARKKEEDPESVSLPMASTSQHGTSGQCCLYALVTALLCIFDEQGVVKIVMDILPDHLLQYIQDDIRLTNEPGPLYSAVRSYVLALAKEEQNSRATQSLRRSMDNLRIVLGPVSLDIPTNSDYREICGFLDWLSVPFSKRQCFQYPTRSFLVWALAEILSSLGFDIQVSKIPVQTVETYSAIFVDNGTTDQMMVHFVTATVGRTDPYVKTSFSLIDTPLPATVRVLPIRRIPHIELAQYLRGKDELKEHLCKAWEFTFSHVQDQDPDKWVADLTPYQKAALEPYNTQNLEHGRVSLAYQNLKRPVSKFVSLVCSDCSTRRRDSLWEDSPVRACWTANDPNHNQEGKLALKIIYMAAAYSLACGYVQDAHGPADLDTEVAYELCQSNDVAEFLGRETGWHSWFMDHYRIFRPYSVDSDQLLDKVAQAMCGTSGLPQNIINTGECFGCHANGLTLYSRFLLDPAGLYATHNFVLRFGQPLDLPVNGDLILSPPKPNQLKSLAVQLPPQTTFTTGTFEQSNMVRWDLQPDWEVSEQDIIYQCRMQGIVSLAVSLPTLKVSMHNIASTIQYRICQGLNKHQEVDEDRHSILAEYEDRLSCFVLPYKSIRQEGYSKILLEPRRTITRLGKPAVVILEPFNDPVEHWMALNTQCQPTPDVPFPYVQRLMSPCLRCGLDAISNTTRVVLDTVVILVLTT